MRRFLAITRGVAIAAAIATSFWLVRWLEVAIGAGGFLTGLLLGFLLCVGCIIVQLIRARRAAKKLRNEQLRVVLPEVHLPADSAAYAWAVRRLDGSSVDMHQFRREVLFLNFWSTWCLPCVMELASIERLHRLVGPEGVVFMCIASDEDLDKLRQWVVDHRLTAPVFALSSDDIPLVFDSDLIPATYLVAADGRVALKHEGAAQWDHPRVVAFIRGLLAESAILAPTDPPKPHPPAEGR